jgi:hypothetical protein
MMSKEGSMRKTRTIQIAALNIAMHKPHSPQRYVDLFRDAARSRMLVGQGELRAMMLGDLYGVNQAIEKDELQGEIYRFLKVDANEPWFDLKTKKQATQEEVEKISIPKHLLAHMQRISFVFFPKKHQLWFASKDGKNSLGPLLAQKFFQQLFEAVCADRDYPLVNVTAIPEKNAIDEMFKIHRLRQITLTFRRPNVGDDGSEEEGELLAAMEAQGIYVYSEDMRAGKGGGIKPNDRTKNRAAIAAVNGAVEVDGYDADGKPVQESSEDKPMRIYEKLNTTLETVFDVIRRFRP